MNDNCCDMGGLLTNGLDTVAQLLVTRAFDALWHGTPPKPHDLADDDVDPAEAEEVFRRLATVGRCEPDAGGRVAGVHGITQNPTRHQIIHADGRHHTWCAFDAVGIPAALGIDATATTACPHCTTPTAIPIDNGHPGADTEMVVWLPSDPGEHLIADFCSQSNIFCSADHLGAWLTGRRCDGQALSVGDAADLGRRTWADVAHIAPGTQR